MALDCTLDPKVMASAGNRSTAGLDRLPPATRTGAFTGRFGHGATLKRARQCARTDLKAMMMQRAVVRGDLIASPVWTLLLHLLDTDVSDLADAAAAVDQSVQLTARWLQLLEKEGLVYYDGNTGTVWLTHCATKRFCAYYEGLSAMGETSSKRKWRGGIGTAIGPAARDLMASCASAVFMLSMFVWPIVHFRA